MKNSLIKKCTVLDLTAPLNQPFRIASGQHDQLENLGFTIELYDGTKGFGEAAIASHITGETVITSRQNLESIAKDLVGKNIAEYLSISHQLNERLVKNKAAVAAVEMALLDALTRQMKIPLWKFFGSTCAPLATDITIVIAPLEETTVAASQYYRQGFRTFKIKVGRDEDLDFGRVLAVKKVVKNSAIILDANQGYTADQALSFLKNLKKHGVKPVLLEQPVPREDWEGLKKVSRLADVPVCADESAGTLNNVIELIKQKLVPVINIKLMKFGILQAREAVALARANGVQLMIGAMMESELSSTAAAHFAVGLGGFQFIDLDTPFFIKPAVKIGGLRKVTYLNPKGIYDLSRVKAGIGIEL